MSVGQALPSEQEMPSDQVLLCAEKLVQTMGAGAGVFAARQAETHAGGRLAGFWLELLRAIIVIEDERIPPAANLH